MKIQIEIQATKTLCCTVWQNCPCCDYSSLHPSYGWCHAFKKELTTTKSGALRRCRKCLKAEVKE